MGVHAAGDDETMIHVAMRPTATVLKTITIGGRRVTFIDSLFPLDIKSLLQSVPGIRVSDHSITFVRCQGDLEGLPAALSSRPQRRSAPEEGQDEMSTAHVQKEFLSRLVECATSPRHACGMTPSHLRLPGNPCSG